MPLGNDWKRPRSAVAVVVNLGCAGPAPESGVCSRGQPLFYRTQESSLELGREECRSIVALVWKDRPAPAP